ncbi:MAG: hypothetical protein C4295_05040 [Candidatus Fervidibacterota bacterium]
MGGWRKWGADNPVLRYHLVGQLRAIVRRPWWQIALIGLPCGVLYGYLLRFTLQGGSPLILGLECLVLWLIAPLMTHALFASEFEKATWDMLVLTRLTAGQIVMGKFLSRLIFLAAFVVLFLPLLAFSAGQDFGTSHILGWLLKTQLVVIGWAVLLIAATLWLSYRLRRGMTTAALVLAGQVFFLFILPALWLLFFALILLTQPPFEVKGIYWMFSLRYAVWFYNPIFALIGTYAFTEVFALIGTYAFTEGGEPFLWGVWQGLVYLALAALLVALLTRSVAKATRKPL